MVHVCRTVRQRASGPTVYNGTLALQKRQADISACHLMLNECVGVEMLRLLKKQKVVVKPINSGNKFARFRDCNL